MPIFETSFIVRAPIEAVAAFHADTSVLKTLNPPLVFVQLHRVDPMAEGSISEFTLWMGPFPIRWRAIHSGVSPNGFTDTLEDGLMASWRHTHHFEAVDEHTTQIHETIVYEYPSGLQGLLPRLLFSKFGLTILFTYRKWATRSVLN